MRLFPAHVLGFAAVVASVAIAPSISTAQAPAGRTSMQAAPPPPVPTVVQPAEGQVVAGDLLVAVQVPAGVPATEYTIEAAYWDPSRNNWVYPGMLGRDFPGGASARTEVSAEVRRRHNQKATRWRIHVRTTRPPGGWGPWREFTWQDAPSAPEGQSGTRVPSPGPPNTAAPPAGDVSYPNPGPPNMPNPGPPNMPNPGPPSMPDPGPPNAPSTGAPAGTQLPSPGPPTVPAPVRGVLQAIGQTPIQLQADVLKWFDGSVGNRTILGAGVGESANAKLKAARDLLASAGRMIESGKTPEACRKLQELTLRTDGIMSPPDLLTGTQAGEMLKRLTALRSRLACN